MKTAVFDFDKTIISQDTGYEFFLWMVYRSKLRTCIMFFLSPIVWLLSLHTTTRGLALQIFSFVATFAINESLNTLRKAFILYFFTEKKAKIYKQAKREIERHQASGRQILILSGSPSWLIKAVCLKAGIRGCKVVGTRQEAKYGFLNLKALCYGEKKILLAKTAGFNVRDWDYGYTDSFVDLPFIKHCKYRFLINPTRFTQRYFHKHLTAGFATQNWQ